MRHSAKVVLAVLGLSVSAVSLPAFAQSMYQGARTCSQAYGSCFDYCSKKYGGGVASAHCVELLHLATGEV